MRARLNIIVSTGHRDWVLGILAGILARGIRGATPKIVEFPQSRRNTRNLRGSLYLPTAAHNVFLHQDLALTAFQKGWLNKKTQNRYTSASSNAQQLQFSLVPNEALYGTGSRAISQNRRGFAFQNFHQYIDESLNF